MCLEKAEGEVVACSMYQPNLFWRTWYGLRKIAGFPAKSTVMVGYAVADSDGNQIYEEHQEIVVGEGRKDRPERCSGGPVVQEVD